MSRLELCIRSRVKLFRIIAKNVTRITCRKCPRRSSTSHIETRKSILYFLVPRMDIGFIKCIQTDGRRRPEYIPMSSGPQNRYSDFQIPAAVLIVCFIFHFVRLRLFALVPIPSHSPAQPMGPSEGKSQKRIAKTRRSPPAGAITFAVMVALRRGATVCELCVYINLQDSLKVSWRMPYFRY